MFAWILALVCLFHSEAPPGGSTLPSAALAIYLTTDPSQPAAPVETMKLELNSVLQDAGYQVIWADPRHTQEIAPVSNLIVLELRGTCGLPPGTSHMDPAVNSGSSLAQTLVSPHGVTPFSWVNCANLTRMIGPALAEEPGAMRDYLYGRAMARVVAHEIYHVVMGSREHSHSGVAKADFTVNNLIEEVFHFEPADLAKMRQKAMDALPLPASEADADAATGR